MNGHILGIATLFHNVTKPGFIHIWFGDHQIDIVLQGRYSRFSDDYFYQTLMNLISYLWIQKNLISAIRPKAPKVADTCWELMGKIRDWFKRNKTEINMHVNDKQLECANFPIW